MAKKRRKPKPKGIRPPTERQRKREAELAGMRMLIRQAAKTGAAEAIEHCANFWSVSDGYKRYINYQIETQAEALMAAVRTALRQDRELANARRKRKP